MWYWDFAPPSWHHAKKPLTRAQIKKLQESYKKAEEISENVRTLEEIEQEKSAKEMDSMINWII
jgi:hypothetical protein